MTKLVSDNFQRVNESPLSGGGAWTSPVTNEVAVQLASNACEGTTVTGAPNTALYSGIAWPNDQYAEITIAAIVANTSAVGVILRCSLSAENYYTVYARNGRIFIFVCSAGTQTLLGSHTVTAPGVVAGGIVKGQIQGNTISGFYNGVLQLSVTDSTFSSGSAGILIESATTLANAQASSWDGGNLHFSVIDDRNYGNFADDFRMVQGTATYDVPDVDSRTAQVLFEITSCANAAGGNTAYTGTFVPASFPVNSYADIVGFVTNPQNNGSFKIVSCTATTLIVANPNGVAEGTLVPVDATVQVDSRVGGSPVDCRTNIPQDSRIG